MTLSDDISELARPVDSLIFDEFAPQDPIAHCLSASDLNAWCARHLNDAGELLGEIRALHDQPDDSLNWSNTLGKIERIHHSLSQAGAIASLMAVAHPGPEVRQAARPWEPRVEQFSTNMLLDRTLAQVIDRFAASSPELTGSRARLLTELQRDLRRNGMHLSSLDQDILRKLNVQLSELGQSFSTNLADASASIRVRPEQLAGLPKAFIERHPPEADGLVTITTDYPDYFAAIAFADDRSMARELAVLFDNRAAGKNISVLDKILELRMQKAQLLGYKCWADFAIEPRMARTTGTVLQFIAQLGALVGDIARDEYELFDSICPPNVERLGGRIVACDRLYVEQKLRSERYGFDSRELSEYFEVTAVTRGVLEISSQLFGVHFVPAPQAAKWHADVTALDVVDRGHVIARVYLDLYPREGKYKHAAMYGLRNGRLDESGNYQPPIVALLCNFPHPGSPPALLSHSEVATLFHEFGHALHGLLTREPLCTYAGTNTVRDFVETPSQVFEEWAYRRETLDLFAFHYQSGQRIPDALFNAMTHARAVGRALGTQRQLALSALDLEYHCRPWPFSTDDVLAETMSRYQLFAQVPDVHFQATFGHLIDYDAGYYGYQWALSLARDAIGRFQTEGFMNQAVAAQWRAIVLEPGGGRDENSLVAQFLGREPALEAYGQYLREGLGRC